jgi:hypothetical protein
MSWDDQGALPAQARSGREATRGLVGDGLGLGRGD